MERFVFKLVWNYFHSNNLFYHYQADFLQVHYTMFQLLDTYHNIGGSRGGLRGLQPPPLQISKIKESTRQQSKQ